MHPVLALIIANMIWGAGSPIFKFSLENIPPFTLAFFRFFLAGLIFIPLCLGNWKKLNLRQWSEILAVGFFGISLNITFFFLGLEITESINAPVIASAGPVFIYFLSIIFLRERPKAKVLAGMLLALLGITVIIFSPILLDGKRLIMGEVKGNLFFVLATFGTVMHTIIGRDILRKINVFQASAITFIFGAATFLPFMIREFRYWDISYLDGRGVLGIGYGAIFSSALAYSLFYYGLSKIKANEAGIFTYIDPVTAVVIAIPLLGEVPGFYYILGSLLVFAGIYFAERRIQWHPFHRLRKKLDLIGKQL